MTMTIIIIMTIITMSVITMMTMTTIMIRMTIPTTTTSLLCFGVVTVNLLNIAATMNNKQEQQQ